MTDFARLVRKIHKMWGVGAEIGIAAWCLPDRLGIPKWAKAMGATFICTQALTTTLWWGDCPLSMMEDQLERGEPVNPMTVIQPVATFCLVGLAAKKQYKI